MRLELFVLIVWVCFSNARRKHNDRSQRNCMKRHVLLSTAKIGAPFLMNVHLNTSTLLPCNYCGEQQAAGEDKVGASWSVDDFRGTYLTHRPAWLRPGAHHELKLSWNPSAPTAPSGPMAPKAPTVPAVYSCKHVHGPDLGRPLRYVLDLEVSSVNGSGADALPPIRGTAEDWSEYKRSVLGTINSNLSGHYHLEALSDWSEWSPCRKRRRERLGSCRLRGRDLPEPLFTLGCRSQLLAQLLPAVLSLTSSAADFVEVDEQCSPTKAPLGPREVLSLEVHAGEQRIVICPGTSLLSPAVWEKDGVELDSPAPGDTSITATRPPRKPGRRWRLSGLGGLGRHGKQRESQRALVRVDAVGALHLDGTLDKDSSPIIRPPLAGLYSCRGRRQDKPALRVRVGMLRGTGPSGAVRHAAYILGASVLALLAYLTVLAIMCRRRRVRVVYRKLIPGLEASICFDQVRRGR